MYILCVLQVPSPHIIMTGSYVQLRSMKVSRDLTLHGLFVGVFFSLGNISIPNHGYVVISDIGSTDETALLCNTNYSPTGGGTSGGNWFAPDGTRVGDRDSNKVPGFRRNRGSGVVRLIGNTATDPPAEGMYRCQIQDDTMTTQTVYVGLYNSGGGWSTNNSLS